MELITTRLTNAGQRLTLTRTGKEGGRKFRTTISRDSHDFQSSAKVELWTDAGWTNVVYVPGEHESVASLDTSYAHRVETKRAEVEASYLALALALEDEARQVAL